MSNNAPLFATTQNTALGHVNLSKYGFARIIGTEARTAHLQKIYLTKNYETNKVDIGVDVNYCNFTLKEDDAKQFLTCLGMAIEQMDTVNKQIEDIDNKLNSSS